MKASGAIAALWGEEGAWGGSRVTGLERMAVRAATQSLLEVLWSDLGAITGAEEPSAGRLRGHGPGRGRMAASQTPSLLKTGSPGSNYDFGDSSRLFRSSRDCLAIGGGWPHCGQPSVPNGS